MKVAIDLEGGLEFTLFPFVDELNELNLLFHCFHGIFESLHLIFDPRVHRHAVNTYNIVLMILFDLLKNLTVQSIILKVLVHFLIYPNHLPK